MNKRIKICFILLFVFLFLILFCNSTKASFDFSFNNINYSVPDLPTSSSDFDSEHFAIFTNGDTFTILSFIDYDPLTMRICNSNNTNGFMGIVNLDGTFQDVAKIVFWQIVDDSWSKQSWQPGSQVYQYYNGEEMQDKFVYSNVNIYLGTKYNGGFVISDDFFFGAVLYQVPVLTKVEELPTVIVGTLKGIIPVSSIVLLVVLLILLLRSVISRLR